MEKEKQEWLIQQNKDIKNMHRDDCLRAYQDSQLGCNDTEGFAGLFSCIDVVGFNLGRFPVPCSVIFFFFFFFDKKAAILEYKAPLIQVSTFYPLDA